MRESKVLREVVRLAYAYEAKVGGPGKSSRFVAPPTTLDLSKHFKTEHSEMLKMLRGLEKTGLLQKSRRLSAGLSGNGYDGSLYSAVLPTTEGKNLVQNGQRP